MWLEQDDIPKAAEIRDMKKSDTSKQGDSDRSSEVEGLSDQAGEHGG